MVALLHMLLHWFASFAFQLKRSIDPYTVTRRLFRSIDVSHLQPCSNFDYGLAASSFLLDIILRNNPINAPTSRLTFSPKFPLQEGCLLKKKGETLHHVSCPPLHFFRALVAYLLALGQNGAHSRLLYS